MTINEIVDISKIIKNNNRFNQDKERLIDDLFNYFKKSNPKINFKLFKMIINS